MSVNGPRALGPPAGGPAQRRDPADGGSDAASGACSRERCCAFESLGAPAEPVNAVDDHTANELAVLNRLEDVGLIYMTGGSPTHLLRVLRETLLWNAIQSAWSSGAVVAGSSAGAMVLGEWMLEPGNQGAWVHALAAVPNVAVLPHFERWTPERRQYAMGTKPTAAVLVGIPGAGGIVAFAGDRGACVIGERAVTVVTAQGDEAVLHAGDPFPVTLS